MIKRYKNYIKEQIDHLNEIDPFGEEDWDDDNLSPLLQIARKWNKPYDQIKSLNCIKKRLTSLVGIENLVNLEVLYCSSNILTSLVGIENLVNLRELYCSFNSLTNLDSIENLVNINTLYCHNNHFSDEYIKYLKDYCKKKNILLGI